MAQHVIKITKNRGVKQTATDRPFDERNEDVKNILLLKAVPSILNVPMSICVYLFACVYMNTEKGKEENIPAITAKAGRWE